MTLLPLCDSVPAARSLRPEKTAILRIEGAIFVILIPFRRICQQQCTYINVHAGRAPEARGGLRRMDDSERIVQQSGGSKECGQCFITLRHSRTEQRSRTLRFSSADQAVRSSASSSSAETRGSGTLTHWSSSSRRSGSQGREDFPPRRQRIILSI